MSSATIFDRFNTRSRPSRMTEVFPIITSR